MDVASLKEERTKNLVDALSFKEPAKIPVGAEILSWPFSYAGVRYADVMDDPKRMSQEYVKFLDAISLDFMWGGNISQPVKACWDLDCGNYDLSEDGVTVIHVQPDVEFMTADEYPELMADPKAFADKMLKKHVKALNLPEEEAYPKLIEALKATRDWVVGNDLIAEEIFDKRGIVPITGSPLMYFSPLNTIFDFYRGMAGTLVDLRRCPDKVKAYSDMRLAEMKEMLSGIDPASVPPFPLGTTVYHSECFLNPKQYDEYFFTPFKELFGPYMEAGAKFFLKGEGSFLNTIDRFRELPKGSVVFMLDQDDPFEAYKAIGDWQCLATGITVDLLKMGTVEECKDFVKRAFDTFAPGGGFIFMQNKPLLCAADAKTENLVAVYELANELSQQH